MESLEEYASSAREESGDVLQSPSDGPDSLLMTAERHELVAEALASLDEESREIVTLRFFERMQARDIAEIIGSTEGAVRTRLHRILKSLRDVYQSAKDDL
jgi:RNA polymerase sigma-70 factor (ECF subfamily)